MIKVKTDLIKKVITLGEVVTRRYVYYCDGRISFGPENLINVPFAFVVYRIACPGPKDFDPSARPKAEIVGLYDSEGRKI